MGRLKSLVTKINLGESTEQVKKWVEASMKQIVVDAEERRHGFS